MTAAGHVHHPVLTGHRLVSGLWFPSDWFDAATRQRLLLQAWRPNSTACRFAAGDLLRWPEPTMQDCDALPGWPLQQLGRALASASLTPEELLGQSQADLWLVLGAELVGLRQADAELLDPSTWLSLKDIPFTDSWDLRPPVPEAVFVGMEPARDVRQVLGGNLPPASAEAQSFLAALSKRQGASSPNASSRQSPGDGSGEGSGISGWAIVALVIFALNIGRLLTPTPAPPPYSPPPPQLRAPYPPATTGSSETNSPLFGSPQTYTGLPEPTSGRAGSDRSSFKDLNARQDAALDQARQSSRTVPGTHPSWPVSGDAPLAAGQPPALPGPSTTVPAAPPMPQEAASSPQASEPEANPMAPFLFVIGMFVVIVLTTVLLILVRRFMPGKFAARGLAAARPTAAKAGASGAGGKGPTAGAAPSEGLRPRLRDRVLPQRWRAWLARLAMTSGVARILGRQHAAYVRRMLAMFEDGKIEDALRHAIPLGQDHESLGQLLGRFGPRQDLSLSGARGASASVRINESLEQHLRNLYRSVFTRLDREGRIDEAAFVLAELLRCRAEALDYLEKHDRCKQAAELALGWDMPAAQIIRLLALSGDWRRALLVARRDNAFAAAVALLQNRSPEMVTRLRREWAESLVAQGRWLAAVDAIWPVVDARADAAQWLETAEQAGGSSAARALALRSQCLPDTLAARADTLRRIQADPAMARERAAMALQLLALDAPVSHRARELAAALAGPLLADHESGEGQLRPLDLRRLVEFAADPVLSADMPPGVLSERRSQSLLGRDTVVRWQAPEAGLQPLHDAVPLLDGEFLVALGEPGLLRLDARGRRIGRIDVPAHRIVVAHDGHSALALARRGTMWRVSRLDLVRMQAHDLGHIAAQAFADQYDGLGWTVANGTRVQVFDTSGPKLDQVLWQVADLPGPVVAIDASEHSETWLLQTGTDQFESWCYVLPRRSMVHREPMGDLPGNTQLVPVAGVGVLALTASTTHPASSQLRPTPARPGLWPSCATPAPGHPVRAAFPWIAMRSTQDPGDGSLASGPGIDFTLLQTGRVQASMAWPVEAAVFMRIFPSGWLLHDLQGRLAVVSLQHGWVDSLSVV